MGGGAADEQHSTPASQGQAGAGQSYVASPPALQTTGRRPGPIRGTTGVHTPSAGKLTGRQPPISSDTCMEQQEGRTVSYRRRGLLAAAARLRASLDW